MKGLINNLKTRLGKPLPGEEVQFLMSPLHRKKNAELDFDELKPKQSAILILLHPTNEIIHTTFIVRPQYTGVHSGQVAFPGGKFEEKDITLQNTALRETEEEIGIPSSDIEVIGKLTELYIPPSNYLVTPYVGVINYEPQFKPDPREVDKIEHYSILELGNERIKKQKYIKLGLGFEIEAPYYDINGHTVWGATAMMICEFNELIKEL